MNWRIPLTLLAASPLAACSYAVKPLPVPANLTQPCPPIRQLPNEATLGDLLEADLELIADYQACSAKHKALAEWVNK